MRACVVADVRAPTPFSELACAHLNMDNSLVTQECQHKWQHGLGAGLQFRDDDRPGGSKCTRSCWREYEVKLRSIRGKSNRGLRLDLTHDHGHQC